MKKLLVVLVMILSSLCFAKEGSIRPSFQAFAGGLLKLKPAEGGYHKFSLKVNAAPWAFHAIGEVRAPAGDPNLLINALFENNLYAVLAYVPQVATGSDGKEYNVGLFDMMLYYDDEPTVIKNLKFKLLPPADDEWAQSIFKDAQESGSLIGRIWKGKYDRAIIRASANPLDKQKVKEMQEAARETNDGNVAKVRDRHNNEDDMPVSRNLNKGSKKEKSSTASKKKKRRKKNCNDPSLSVKEQRRCEMQNQ